MPPPTLAELLNFYRDHPLPEEVNEAYSEYTVEGLPVCSGDDSREYDLLGYPDESGNVVFLPPNQITSESTFVNPDDDMLRRVLTGTGGLLYEREGHNASGESMPMGRGTLHLCRSESPLGDSGRYSVSVSDNAVINNTPGNPAPLRRVAFAFTQPEIEALVHGLHLPDGTPYVLPSDHYLVDPTNHSQLSLMPDRAELDQLITLIESDGSPIPAERREPIVAALQEFIRTEATQADVLDEQMRMPPWVLTILGVVGGSLATIPVMWWMQRRNEALMRELQEGPKINIGELFDDPTESMRVRDRVTIPDSQRRYVEAIRSRFNQGSFPHVVLSGPSGSGKSFTADLIGRLAVNGQLGVEAFEGQNVHFVRIDAKEIVRSAGSWQNGAQSRFFEVLNRLTRDHSGPLIIHLLEADKFAAAGQGPGNQPLNLLKELYTIMEGVNPQYRNVHFILDSTRWQTIRDAAPDMLRRAQFMEIIPATPEDLRRAIENGIRSRRTSHKDDRIRQRFERITFSPDALDAITTLGEYRDGAPPSSNLDLVDKLAEQASQHTNGNLVITREHVLRYIARDQGRRLAEVRALLDQRLGAEGIRHNPRIQQAIVEAFYREYPQPMRGRVNPMDLAAVAEANPVSIFDDVADHDAPSPDPAPPPPEVSGSPPPPPPAAADSPIIHGADARPVDGISRAIVRAQILQRFTRFLTPRARRALEDGTPFPTDPNEVIHGDFRSYVDALTTRIVAEYNLRLDDNRADIDRRWEDQARESGYVLREGVPDSLLREVASDYFDREAARTGSPFGGGIAGTFRADAERRIGVGELERHMELLRHIGR